MFKLKLEKRTKVLVVAGGALLFIGLIYRFSPFLGTSELRAEIAIKEKKLEKYRKVVQEKKVLEAQVASLNRTLGQLESGLLSGETPALAAVDIQNLLNSITAGSAVDIKTMRVLQPEEGDQNSYPAIPVQFTITCNIRKLKEILYRIEASPKYLTIMGIRVSVPNQQQPELVQSIFTVAGFMKKPGT